MNKYQSLIITPIKNENKYLSEFIEHYRAMNFTKIILIDNNDSEGEYAENVYDIIDKYDTFIDVIDYKDKPFTNLIQNELLKSTYLTQYKNYDFICFFDCDEFLELDPKYNNDINNFFDNEWCHTNDGILINYQYYNGLNNLRYENKPLKDRLTNTISYRSMQTKPIINCNNIQEQVELLSIHSINSINICYANGLTAFNTYKNENDIYEGAKLKHYTFKSIEEFLFKYLIKNNKYYSHDIVLLLYKLIKPITIKHIDYIVEYMIKTNNIYMLKEFLTFIYKMSKDEEFKNYIKTNYKDYLNNI